MRMKTADLNGFALAWATAEALKWIEPMYNIGPIDFHVADNFLSMSMPDPDEYSDELKPSDFNHYIQWAPYRIRSQYAVLLERFGIGVAKFYEPVDGPVALGLEWSATSLDDTIRMDGPSPGVAVCRVVVAVRLGLEIDVPDHVLTIGD